MAVQMKTKALIAVVTLLLLPGVSHALTDEQKVLVGLRGVGVKVEDMDPQAERLGLTKAQIRTDVELRLRKAGVTVLTEKERIETPGIPLLSVKANTNFSQKLPFVTYSTSVDLNEWVTLARGGETYGAIWSTASLGTIGTTNISKIRDFLGDRVDQFINDYLAANPKK
jgi:hypothetical protein